MKYIRCGNCNNLIAEGSTVYYKTSTCGTFCSPRCFTEYHAAVANLTEKLAEECCTNMITISEDSSEKSNEETPRTFATPGQLASRKWGPFMTGIVVKIVNDEEFLCDVGGVNILCNKNFWEFSDHDS